MFDVSFDITDSTRERRCRICDGYIDKTEKSMVMRNIKPTGSTCVDLHFHPNCFLEKCKDILNPTNLTFQKSVV